MIYQHQPWAVSAHQTAELQISPPLRKPRLSPFPNITSVATFNRQHRLRDDRLQEYLDHPHRNYRTLSHDLRALVLHQNAMCLHPCNAQARINLARIVLRHLDLFDIGSREPIVWGSITPLRFVFVLDDIDGFNPRRLIASVREAFGPIPFLAIVEAAHYRWSPYFGEDRADRVSFHVHFICSGFSRAKVLQQLDGFARRHRGINGRSSVWARRIAPDRLNTKILYALKGPAKSYQIIPRPGQLAVD